jgi:hypothetical protein
MGIPQNPSVATARPADVRGLVDPNTKLDDFDRSFTIPEFCKAEGISEPTYYKLKREGLHPDELRYFSVVRITPQARREWHERMTVFKERRAAKLEAQRRTAHAKSISQKSIASPNHVSKQGKRAKKK